MSGERGKARNHKKAPKARKTIDPDQARKEVERFEKLLEECRGGIESALKRAIEEGKVNELVTIRRCLTEELDRARREQAQAEASSPGAPGANAARVMGVFAGGPQEAEPGADEG